MTRISLTICASFPSRKGVGSGAPNLDAAEQPVPPGIRGEVHGFVAGCATAEAGRILRALPLPQPFPYPAPPPPRHGVRCSPVHLRRPCPGARGKPEGKGKIVPDLLHRGEGPGEILL